MSWNSPEFHLEGSADDLRGAPASSWTRNPHQTCGIAHTSGVPKNLFDEFAGPKVFLSDRLQNSDECWRELELNANCIAAFRFSTGHQLPPVRPPFRNIDTRRFAEHGKPANPADPAAYGDADRDSVASAQRAVSSCHFASESRLDEIRLKFHSPEVERDRDLLRISSSCTANFSNGVLTCPKCKSGQQGPSSPAT